MERIGDQIGDIATAMNSLTQRKSLPANRPGSNAFVTQGDSAAGLMK
jgi:hypothetical protein